MKNKLAQLVSFVGKIDPRQIQFAYFVVALATIFVIQGPSDGSVGPY